MKVLFLLLPFAFTALVAYRLNAKLHTTNKERMLLSFYEGLTVSFIGLILFYARFFSIWLNILFMLAALFMMLGRIWSDQMHHADEDLKIETIKNTTILFVIGYIPVLVFLTIFRYIPFYLQIPLSIGAALLIVFITFKTQKYTTAAIEYLTSKFQMADWHKYIYVWIGLAIFSAIYVSLRVPTDSIKNLLNLSNQSTFYNSIGLPYDTQNNFEQEILFQVDNITNRTISDYEYNDEFIYVLYTDGSLTVYDREENEITASIATPRSPRDLIMYDGEVFVKNSDGLYKVIGDNTEFMTETDGLRDYFYNDGVFHFYLLSDDELHYEIYEISNGIVSLVETLEISSLNGIELVIISETLFFENNSILEVYDHPELTFTLQEGNPYYDVASQTLYIGKTSIEDYETTYSWEGIIDGNSSLSGYYEDIPYVFEDVIYYTNKAQDYFASEGERVLIQNSDSEINTVFIHSGMDKASKWNDYTTFVLDYRIGPEGLEFIQYDTSSTDSITTIYTLVEYDVDIAFPFYSYFGIGTVYFILLAMIIPITNYSSSITVLGGKQNLNIKKSAE